MCQGSRVIEVADDEPRQLGEIAERGQHWPAERGITLAERYVVGDLKIALRRVDVGPRYYGAILEAGPLSGKFQPLSAGGCGNRDHCQRRIHLNQTHVFSCNVEVVQGEQLVIPSTIRPQSFQADPLTLSEPLFAFRRVQRVDEILEGGIKGKVTVGVWLYAVPCRQCRRKQIEAAAEAADDSANAGIDEIGNFPVHPELDEFLPHLRVVLSDEGIRVTVGPAFDLLLQHWEIGCGPVDGRIGV